MQKNIPYFYGGRSKAGADCWGIVVLHFAAKSIDLPHFLEFYSQHPDHQFINIKTVLRLSKISGLVMASDLVVDTICLGVNSNGHFGFGVWLGGSVLTTCPGGSLERSWEDFKRGYDRVLMWRLNNLHQALNEDLS
jgi:NlpC/P60 family